jgi:hypothetical protein
MRRTTEQLSPYDIEAAILRKSVGTAGKQMMRTPSSALSPLQQAARSPNSQLPGLGMAAARSTHAGRAMQQHEQAQRQHRAARRTVSTPLIKPAGSPQPAQELHTAVSASPSAMGHHPSRTTPSLAGRDAAAADGHVQQQQQQRQFNAGEAGMHTPGSSYPSHLQQQQQQQYMTEESNQGYGSDQGASSSGRSVYLEHSASTGDGNVSLCPWHQQQHS